MEYCQCASSKSQDIAISKQDRRLSKPHGKNRWITKKWMKTLGLGQIITTSHNSSKSKIFRSKWFMNFKKLSYRAMKKLKILMQSSFLYPFNVFWGEHSWKLRGTTGHTLWNLPSAYVESLLLPCWYCCTATLFQYVINFNQESKQVKESISYRNIWYIETYLQNRHKWISGFFCNCFSWRIGMFQSFYK